MKFLKIFALAILLLTATMAGAALRLKEFWDSAAPSHREPNQENLRSQDDSRSSPDEPASADVTDFAVPATTRVLIAGLDDVESVNRSDSLALAVFDEVDGYVRIVSIPRDSRVRIPGRGLQKINHAYAYGGMDLLKQTVSEFLDVDIDYFIVLGFQSFPRIIDLLGGIDIDVEKKLYYRDRSQKLLINIPKGPQHMDGKTALEYVRFRNDPLGDIGRVQRQQKFVSIVLDKLKSPMIIPKIPFLVSETLSAVKTDLTLSEALRLARFANELPSTHVKMLMAPGRADYIDKLSYWIVDVNATQAWMAGETADSLADVNPFSSREDVESLVAQIGDIGILNGDGGSGLSRKASQIFQKLGINVAHTGNAEHFNHQNSSIVRPENAAESDLAAADALAQLCGIPEDNFTTGSASVVSVILGRDKEKVFKRLEAANF